MEHAGETLSRYEVDYRPGAGGLRGVGRPELFESTHRWGRPQLRLFRLEDVLGDGWLKALRLDPYVLRKRGRPTHLQQPLFGYADAL